LVDCGYYVV
jgi:hypothetical protein